MLTGGVLDPTFGTGGVVNSSLGASTRAFSVATYPQAGTANDGKIVVGGAYITSNHKSEFGVVRYNLDGSLDSSFGGSGEVFGPASGSFGALSIAIQADGRILAASDQNGDFAVVRYNADGSLDKTFGNRGLATTAIASNSFDRIYAIAVQPDGRIVAAGTTNPTNSTNREVVLVRYNANGTLDTTFGKNGKALDQIATSPMAGGATERMALAIDPGTGQIVVQAAGPMLLSQGAYPAMVIRYTSAGVLDKQFGETGYETFDGVGLPILESQSAVSIQPTDHRLLVAGRTEGGGQSWLSLARLNPDGTPDGSLFVTNTVDQSQMVTVKLQSDGRIVVGTMGWVTYGSGNTLTVARYNSDLSSDTSFGTGGVAAVSALSGDDYAGMALEPDGRIVEVGNPDLGYWRVDIARFLATGPQIGSFSASPDSSLANGVMLTAGSVASLNPGSTVTQVAFYVDSNGDGLLEPDSDTLLGYGTLSGGLWTFIFSTSGWTSRTFKLFAQAEDSYGVLSDPLSLDLTVL